MSTWRWFLGGCLSASVGRHFICTSVSTARARGRHRRGSISIKVPCAALVNSLKVRTTDHGKEKCVTVAKDMTTEFFT